MPSFLEQIDILRRCVSLPFKKEEVAERDGVDYEQAEGEIIGEMRVVLCHVFILR